MRKNMQSANDKGYRIIAVDDEEGIVDSLSIFLKRSGYDFTGVTDPMEAIEKVKNEQLEAILGKASIKWVKAPLMQISGTFIRNGIRKGKDMSYYLNPAVWNYIREMHFYE